MLQSTSFFFLSGIHVLENEIFYVIVTANAFPFCLTMFFIFYHPMAIVYELYEVANTVNARALVKTA